MASARPGAEAVVTRPTDALLAQAIRQCLLEVDRSAGPPGAITDPQIARALRLIRETPAAPGRCPGWRLRLRCRRRLSCSAKVSRRTSRILRMAVRGLGIGLASNVC
jgi:hypothetical protein